MITQENRNMKDRIKEFAKFVALLCFLLLFFFIFCACSPESSYLFFNDDTITLIKGESFDVVEDFVTTNLLKNNKFIIKCDNESVLYINGTQVDAIGEGVVTLHISVEGYDDNFNDSIIVSVCERYEENEPEFKNYLYFEEENVSLYNGESKTLKLKGLLKDRVKLSFYPEGVVDFNYETYTIKAVKEGKVKVLAETLLSGASMDISAIMNVYVESKIETLTVELLNKDKAPADFVVHDNNEICGHFLLRNVKCLADFKLETTFERLNIKESVCNSDGLLIPFVAVDFGTESGKIVYTNNESKIESNVLNFDIFANGYNSFPTEILLSAKAGKVENSFTVYVNMKIEEEKVYFPFIVYLVEGEQDVIASESDRFSCKERALL